MPDHRSLRPRDRDPHRLAGGRRELDNIGPVFEAASGGAAQSPRLRKKSWPHLNHLLAPMIRTFATASCSWSDPPGSRHVLASQPHRKRNGLETHSNAWRSHAARSCVAAKTGWLSLEKNRPHIDRNLFAIHPVTNSEDFNFQAREMHGHPLFRELWQMHGHLLFRELC
jgi:hypothetical protein